MRRIGAATLLVALLAACASAGSATGAPAALRVLVFNIFAGKDTAGASNLERVASLVRASDADVVLLQEVDSVTRRSGGVDQPAVLASRTGYFAAFGSSLDYQGGEYGVAILSRWPIASDSMVSLPISPPQARAGGSYEPRGALVVRIDAPGGRIAVINTHLDASGDDQYRRQELGTVLRLAREQLDAGMPVLVGGDFNSRPDSEVIRRALANGWVDLWTECGGSGTGNTYPAHAPIRRIDYLFLASRGTCTDARVVGQGVSDHLGVLIDVRMYPR